MPAATPRQQISSGGMRSATLSSRDNCTIADPLELFAPATTVPVVNALATPNTAIGTGVVPVSGFPPSFVLG